MTSSRALSAVTAVLVCGAAAAGFASLRFARSVMVTMLERGGLEDAALSRLATFALLITRTPILAAVLIVGIAAVVTSEIAAGSEGSRLLVQLVVLLLLVLLLSTVVTGLFIPFHIPDVRIP